jgi:hypothetical protein
VAAGEPEEMTSAYRATAGSLLFICNRRTLTSLSSMGWATWSPRVGASMPPVAFEGIRWMRWWRASGKSFLGFLGWRVENRRDLTSGRIGISFRVPRSEQRNVDQS